MALKQLLHSRDLSDLKGKVGDAARACRLIGLGKDSGRPHHLHCLDKLADIGRTPRGVRNLSQNEFARVVAN